ncbi:GHKL domain-containing protein [Enterococcus sp. LJL98]
MFYLMAISDIIQTFLSFSVLDKLSLKKKKNGILALFILFLVSSVHLNLRLATMNELVLSVLLLAFSFMNHRQQPMGLTLFHLSLAFIIQKTVKVLALPRFVLIYLATEANLFMMLCYFLFTIMLVVGLSLKVQRHLCLRISRRKKQNIGYFLFMLLFMSQIYSLYQYILMSPAETQFGTLIKMFVVLSIFMVTVGGMSLYVLANNQKLAFETREKAIEQEAMQLYITEISKQNQEIQKFRHDYMNILSSLEGYLEQGDLEALTTYYRETIQPTRSLFLAQTSRLNDLQKIENLGIRSVFMAKLLLAQEKGMQVQLEVEGPIVFSPKLNELMFIRVLGILLDNALEELEELGQGTLTCAIFTCGVDTMVLIQNTVRKTIEPLYQLKEQGFSTKGEQRGYGLSTVNDWVNQSENLLLETQIYQGTFLQKITLLGEDISD